MSENGEEKVIRLRGLPWSATVDNILDFFKDIDIKGGKDGVHLTMSKDGRFNGEAYVELESQDDISEAEKLHKEHIGKRYVEVFSIKKSEMEWAFERAGLSRNEISSDCVVKLRGLPYDATKEEISDFFSGLKICPDGVALPTNPQGRPTGDAFVQFVNQDYADKALEKHREHIDTASKSSRYVEVFRSSLDEVRTVMNNMAGGGGPMGGGRGGGGGGYGNNRSAPYDTRDRVGGMNRGGGFNDGPGWGGPGGPVGMMGGNDFNGGGGGGGNMANGGHFVHMMGLPFRASEMDIANFFVPLNPINIFLGKDKSGRASGKADVEFATHDDATEAMKKDKTNMQHRYIELFLNSKPGGGPMGNLGPIGGPMGGPGGPPGNFGNMGNNFGGPMGGSSGDFGNNFGPGGGPMMGPGNNMGFNNEPSRGPTAGHFVHMRGLPFVATEMDIADFFLPVKPINIYVDKDSSGRASGKAEVEFASHDDAVIAMKKDKENMQHRYINLFLNSKPGPVGGGGGNGNMGGGFGNNIGNNIGNNSPGFGGNFGGNMGNMGPPMGGNMGPPMGGHFVNMRGLPFSASEQDVADFFAPVVPFNIFIGKEPNGRASGKAEVEFSTHADAVQAMKKDKENMQHRYIDLLLNSKSGPPMGGGGGNMGGPPQGNFGGMGNNGPGFGGNMGNNGPGPGFGGPGNMGGGGGGNFGNMGGGHFVNMRGLPFSATEQDIADFFRPINPMNINIMRDNSGRASGKAEVEFATHDDATQAMKKDKENMQHRYIDLLLNSKPGQLMGGGGGNMGGPPGNFGNFGGGMGNNGPGNGGNNMGGFNDNRGGNMGPNMNGGGHVIQMRGLPFNCTEQEIADFFRPVNPLNIFIGKEPNGRSTGKAEVEFATHDDAAEAMKKDKENIQHRYIDLFLNSKPLGKMGGGNFGNSGNNMGFSNRGGFGSR